MRAHRWAAGLLAALLGSLVLDAVAAEANLATSARIAASSEFSAQYFARFVADGVVPGRLSRDDTGRAWCVKRATAGDAGELTFEWPAPVTVGSVVYYGRTAWEMAECWKEYAVVADPAREPLARGRLKMMHGPQVIALPKPVQVTRLTLRFASSYGGSNPGASEVQVFATTTPPKEALIRGPDDTAEFAESAAIAEEIAEGRLGFDRLVLVKRRPQNPSHVYTVHCEDFRPGGGVYVLSPPRPGGKLTELLATPTGQVMSLDVSFDGRELLLAWKRDAKDTFHLYRMNADGSGLKQLTAGDWHDYYGCWLPDGGIAFVSTREPRGPLCFHTPTGVLFRMDRDGGNARKLSASYVDDFTPAAMPDGRILYTRWEYVDRPAIPIQSLWTINPDGTGLRVAFGNRALSPASFLQARAVPGAPTKVLCTLTSHNGPVRGAVGLVDLAAGDNNAQAAIVNLTPEVPIGRVEKGDGNNVKGPYEWPVPIDAERYLVSRDGRLMLGRIDGGLATLLEEEGELGWYCAAPLAPRPAPPVSSAAPAVAAAPSARVYVVDVHRGLDGVKPGTVKSLRVVEEVGKPYAGGSSAFGFQTPVISCGATYAVKRVWGTVPVEPDGSAFFEVPAGRALYFIALDAEGVAVQRMRSFTQLAPGETQGCVGCHDPRREAPAAAGGAPVASVPLALRSGEPARLRPPSWGVRGFDYARNVQPELDKHCVSCHSGVKPDGGADLSGDATEWFSASYDTLTRRFVNWIPTHNGAEANILRIEPYAWGSPKSALTKVVLGPHPAGAGDKAVKLDADARERLLTWIDLNVPYYGTYAATPGLAGGRQLGSPALRKTLEMVWANRCASCHGPKVKSDAYLRIGNPQLNAFLAAPLAADAGGRGSCKPGPVFKSVQDADYQALLVEVRAVARKLDQVGRADVGEARDDTACDPGE